jgi:hypothetical protein
MFTVPPATPVTTPVDAFTVAVPVFPEAHKPPLTLLLKVVVWPIQTVAVPVLVAAGTVIDIGLQSPTAPVSSSNQVR